MYELMEDGIKIKLTISETVDYGDALNRTNSWLPITNFIDDQYEAYLQEELKIVRTISGYHDTRPHVCLYMIRPTGHS